MQPHRVHVRSLSIPTTGDANIDAAAPLSSVWTARPGNGIDAHTTHTSVSQ